MMITLIYQSYGIKYNKIILKSDIVLVYCSNNPVANVYTFTQKKIIQNYHFTTIL